MYPRLFDFLEKQLHQLPLEEMMRSKVNGEWKTISTSAFYDQTYQLSSGLLQAGILRGDKIALITDGNRMEWNICDHAILQIGAIDVPIYPTMSASDIEYILNHSEAVICLVSNRDLYEKVASIKENCKALREIFTFEKYGDTRHWMELHDEQVAHKAQIDLIKQDIKSEELATIIYTSGTTGLPKGVMLSHANIASNVQNSLDRLPPLEKGKARCLSFLPCCHIYERMLHYLYIENSVQMTLTGMENIKDDLIMTRPHIFTAVPRLLEKFYDGIIAKGESNTGIKKKLFQWSVNLALQWEPERANGWWYELKLNIAKKLVFSKVKSALGLTEIGAVASGSAALQPRLARFFTGAGIPVKEGYGLTETSPVITVNTLRRPHLYQIGSVGTPIDECEVKIAEDGEILCKGPNVMLGYYKNESATEEVLKDGYFHTGDIGEFRDGFLFITDRKKELFKTSGGKYVAPQAVENALKESVFIEQCMVVGDGQKFPAALLVLDQVLTKAKFPQFSSCSPEELITKLEVIQAVQQDILEINKRFGNWEQVKAFRLLPHPFSIEKGEITPTLKLKRKKITEIHGELIQEMYV
jgi:long-chain acyl-CoA synthetase